ncbi:MAG: Clp protease [Spirulina sp. SIO3F2]|nr:Clp protease [Spirulina sp. SIO3F2]
MAKVALLIGVSEYQELNPLPSAVRDVAALKVVLAQEAIGGFDHVKTLENPELTQLQDAVYELFEQCSKEDLVLLYFSGHGVKDQSLELFLTTPQTRKNDRGLIVPHTAVSARYLQNRITTSRCQRTVVILDCCYSGAFAKGMTAKDEGKVNVLEQLGGKGRAILTSSTAVQSSFQQDERSLSLYTHYLVEGIKTGAADLDGDGQISADELHQYTHQKVTEESPAMTPEFYPVKEGHRIFVAKAPQDEPLLLYRKEVQRLVAEQDDAIAFLTGEFDPWDRALLDDCMQKWQIPAEAAQQIEQEITEPLRQRYQKLKEYETLYQKAVQHCWPISERIARRLQELQRAWGLRDEDIAPIEARLCPASVAEVPTPAPELSPATSETPDAPVVHSSVKTVDYQTLKALLEQQQWKAANQETFRLMLAATERQAQGWLDFDAIKRLPKAVLRTIDELWTVASQGRFGFSAQKKIWQRLDRGDQRETEKMLGVEVGWRKGGRWTFEIIDDLNAPEGHLPFWGDWGKSPAMPWLGKGISAVLFSQIEICSVPSNSLSSVSSTSQTLADKLAQVELNSAKGADYSKLRDLLKEQAWEDADQETLRLMVEVGALDYKNYLNVEDIKNFPCEDLRSIRAIQRKKKPKLKEEKGEFQQTTFRDPANGGYLVLKGS